MPSRRPLSQLIHFPIQAGEGGKPIVTLHDSSQFAKDVADWGPQASPDGPVTALESYKGVFVAKEIVGYTWFLGPDTAPSPMFFGDSLGEIEKFLWDEIDRSEESPAQLPFLIGIGQGGIMALATALAVPDLLSGVIAVDAFLPKVGGWNPPLAPMNRLPILLANPKTTGHPNALEGKTLETQLGVWDADVESVSVDDLKNSSVLRDWVAGHEIRYISEDE